LGLGNRVRVRVRVGVRCPLKPSSWNWDPNREVMYIAKEMGDGRWESYIYICVLCVYEQTGMEVEGDAVLVRCGVVWLPCRAQNYEVAIYIRCSLVSVVQFCSAVNLINSALVFLQVCCMLS
jgi:hypothetical protein